MSQEESDEEPAQFVKDLKERLPMSSSYDGSPRWETLPNCTMVCTFHKSRYATTCAEAGDRRVASDTPACGREMFKGDNTEILHQEIIPKCSHPHQDSVWKLTEREIPDEGHPLSRC
eukprot:4911019-Amphidinium_carterae.2